MISKAQEVSCEELIAFIKEKGQKSEEVTSLSLDSSWLNNVTLYKYDGKYYVIAKIKKDEYGYSTKSYVFCNIPYSNWSSFHSPYNFITHGTYGERFHEYIIDYVCNCN
jgi:hypothetical protein